MELDILAILDSVSKRPQMYVRPVSLTAIQSFLTGVRVGCGLARIEYTPEDFREAASERGWEIRGSESIDGVLMRSGLSEVEMIHEMIVVEREAYAVAMRRATAPRE
jgi:hypothetical protein